jgi:hypothetical protein
MAIENVFGSSLRRRWALALAFGLVHGFGFAFCLQEQMQFAGSHLLASLLAFNVGVEAGQLLVLAILVPVLDLAFRKAKAETMVTLVISLLVGHTAWHWMLERYERLSRFPWPAFDAASLAGLLRWIMALLVLGALAWGVSEAIRRRNSRGGP